MGKIAKKISKAILIIIEFSVAQMLVAFVGGVIFIFCGMFSNALVGDDILMTTTEDLRPWLIHSAIALIIISIIITRLFREKRKNNNDNKIFISFSIFWFCIGFILYLVIGLWSFAGIYNAKLSKLDGNSCSTLVDQLKLANGAIMPIGTNLGTGTAFAIDGNGTYLTAYHVIDGASRVYKNLTTGEEALTVQGIAPEYDIAVLKSEKPSPVYLKLTSRYNLADQAYAYGYPGNAFTAGGPSVSSGLISRILTNDDLKLTDNDIPAGLEMVQTDAAVNPGNSGGPLINKCGVVGIISATSDKNDLQDYGIVSEQGISYAVSAVTAATRFGLEILK